MILGTDIINAYGFVVDLRENVLKLSLIHISTKSKNLRELSVHNRATISQKAVILDDSKFAAEAINNHTIKSVQTDENRHIHKSLTGHGKTVIF